MTPPSTERRFLTSTLASYGSLLARLLVGFITRLVLARLILPEGHGLYELALRIVIVSAGIRDLGLGYHLMRDRRRPYGTVFAWSLTSAVGVTLGLVLLAPAFGFLDPALPAVLRVFSVWVLLDALVVVPQTFFDRQLEIHRLVLPEVLRSLVGAVVSISLAAWGFGVWSFVFADLLAVAFFAALLWLRAARRIPLEVDLAMLPGLLRQSIWLFGIWVVLQLVTYIDVYIIGALRDTTAVGNYARAYMIAFLVSQIVAPRALVPALVEYRDDQQRFLGAFRLGTAALLVFQVTGGYFLHFNAARVVGILLGENWEPAVGLLKILALVPFVHAFNNLGGEVLKVRHEDRAWLLSALINFVSLFGLGLWWTRRWGAEGMAWANFFLLGELVLAYRMARIFHAGFRQVLADLAFVYLVPLPFFLVAARLTPEGSWSRMAVSVVAAALALAALGARFYRPFRSFFFSPPEPPASPEAADETASPS